MVPTEAMLVVSGREVGLCKHGVNTLKTPETLETPP